MNGGPIKKVYRLQENRYYSRDDLARGLGDCSPEDVSAFVKYMRECEVCKSKPNDKKVSFQYVGIVEFSCTDEPSPSERRIVFIEPKFFPEDRAVDTAEGMDAAQKIILKAILKYRKDQQISLFSNGHITSYEGCSPRLSTYLALVIDVMEKGIYQVPKVELVVNGLGDTDWNETFATVDPFFLQDGPCYVNTVSREIGYDDDTYISRLQMCLATKCLAYFEDIGIAEPLGLFLESPYDGELSDFGSESYQQYRIANELRTQFVDDKKQTLKLMEAVLEDKAYGSDSLEFQSFGISGFHALWEKAIKEVFCDELEKSPGMVFNDEELGKLINGDKSFKTKQNIPLKEFIDAPQWIKPGTDDEGVIASNTDGEADRLKPDFVAVPRKDDKASALVILDAKYYRPEFKEHSIAAAPGVGDVDKQVLYQVAYNGIVQSCKLDVHNAFIFPMWRLNWNDDTEIYSELFARVRVPSLAAIVEKPEFNAYMLDGMALLKRYVYNDSDDDHVSLMKIFEGEKTCP